MNRFLAVSMFALLAVSGVAHGTMIAVEFVGYVDHITGDEQNALAITPRAIFSGIVRFNSELQDQNPIQDDVGEYAPLSPGHVTVEWGRPDVPNYLALFSGSRGHIDVDNVDPGIRFGDEFLVTVGGFFEDCNGITGPPFDGKRLCEFRLQLIDEDGLVFDSDALPLSAPDL